MKQMIKVNKISKAQLDQLNAIGIQVMIVTGVVEKSDLLPVGKVNRLLKQVDDFVQFLVNKEDDNGNPKL